LQQLSNKEASFTTPTTNNQQNSLILSSELREDYQSHEETSEYLISLKLNVLQKYMEPLQRLITKCEEQLDFKFSSTLSLEKQSYFRSSLSNLIMIRSILQGSEFTPPATYSRLEFLEKIENQLVSAVQRLGSHSQSNSSTCQEIKNEKTQKELSFESFLVRNELQSFKNVFIENGITTVHDIKLLSEKNMKELNLPVGARNRINAYFMGFVVV